MRASHLNIEAALQGGGAQDVGGVCGGTLALARCQGFPEDFQEDFLEDFYQGTLAQASCQDFLKISKKISTKAH